MTICVADYISHPQVCVPEQLLCNLYIYPERPKVRC